MVDVPGDEVRRAQDEYLAASEALRAVLRRLEDEVPPAGRTSMAAARPVGYRRRPASRRSTRC